MSAVRGPRRRFPWAIWVLLLVTVGLAYVFFVLPGQLGERQMRIEVYEPEPVR